MKSIKNIIIFFVVILSFVFVIGAYNLYGDYKKLDYKETIYKK